MVLAPCSRHRHCRCAAKHGLLRKQRSVGECKRSGEMGSVGSTCWAAVKPYLLVEVTHPLFPLSKCLNRLRSALDSVDGAGSMMIPFRRKAPQQQKEEEKRRHGVDTHSHPLTCRLGSIPSMSLVSAARRERRGLFDSPGQSSPASHPCQTAATLPTVLRTPYSYP